MGRPDAAAGLVAAAAAAVRGRSVVALAGGPLAVQVALALADVPGLVLVTPSPAVAAAADGLADVLLLPGERQPTGAVAGELTEAAVRSLNLEALVLAAPVCGNRVRCQGGAEAASHRALAAAVDQVVVLAEPGGRPQLLPSCLSLPQVHLLLDQPALTAGAVPPAPVVALAT